MKSYPKRTALEAIRVFCIACQGGSFYGVTECPDLACPFFPYRHGSALEKGRHSPIRACRAFCCENCLSGSSADAVKDCGGDTALLGSCPIYPFRLGKNPNISEATREQHRANASERTAKGVFGFQKQTVHGPFDAPESTKSAGGVPVSGQSHKRAREKAKSAIELGR